MSIPATFSAPALQAMASMSPLDGLLQVFNNNPYFIGLMMILLNLGGRFISLEVTKQQEQFLQLPWVRRLLIFTVLFVATRNLWVAFWMTLIVVLFLGYLFNENSAMCLFGQGGGDGSTCASGSGGRKEGEMTPEEKEILQRLSAKAQRYQQADGKSAGANGGKSEDDEVAMEDIYLANLKLVGSAM
jgi:hypothetical protein